MKTNDVYLRHILEAIEQIEEYVEGVDRSGFMSDSMRQDAVTRQLEIVGEASRQLSESFRKEHDAIPWHAIIGMRNRIAHDYLNVDLEVIWDVVRHDLPGLKQQVRSMLEP
jgi:uncharacterized protein with HEPN domain